MIIETSRRQQCLLNGELKEDAFMVGPSGLTFVQLEQVCKLKKALYNL